jgi:hypothetical protein
LFAVILSAAAACSPAKNEDVERPVQNLRTLAKLYGYLRHFHPSDEAARVDWDALAVLAAGKVKGAPDASALKAALEDIFRPVAPAMVLYVKGEKPPAPTRPAISPDAASKYVSWQHLGLGTGLQNSAYRSIRLNRPSEMSGQTALMQSLDAAELRGKTVKLSAWAKVFPGDMSSQAQLWLRVDGPTGSSFFASTRERPIRTPEWAEYSTAAPVAADAQKIVFGASALGKGKFLVDGFRLSVTDGTGDGKPLVVPNGGFEEGDAGVAPRAWSIQSPTMEFRVQEDDVCEGKRALSFVTKVLPFTVPLFEKRAPADGVIEKEVGQGIFCRVPLALDSDPAGTLPRPEAKDLDRLRAALDELVRVPLTSGDEDVRLGDIVIAWNVFQHFYPYFDVVKVDWDEVLTRSLERALSDRTEEEFLRTLGWLVARLDDGHGGVYHALQNRMGRPPFRVEWVEKKAVVTSSRDAWFRRGDIVLAVDGKNAEDILREEEEYISGSPQWKRFRSTSLFGTGPAGTKSRARLRRGRDVLEAGFERSAQAPTPDPPARPSIDKLADGVLYVDLSRASWPEINARIQELAAARGVVFDLRGYPNGNHQVLSHLLREPDKSSAWMKIPLIVLPDREGWTYQEGGWNLPVASPHIGGRVVFLTDGRAISYAESFLSFVEYYKLGEILGEPTAGANGNVNSFVLPGDYSVSWTGMKVVKHDGSQHHTVGVLPTVPYHRTVAGVAAGRDELLEKALEVIRK